MNNYVLAGVDYSEHSGLIDSLKKKLPALFESSSDAKVVWDWMAENGDKSRSKLGWVNSLLMVVIQLDGFASPSRLPDELIEWREAGAAAQKSHIKEVRHLLENLETKLEAFGGVFGNATIGQMLAMVSVDQEPMSANKCREWLADTGNEFSSDMDDADVIELALSLGMVHDVKTTLNNNGLNLWKLKFDRGVDLSEANNSDSDKHGLTMLQLINLYIYSLDGVLDVDVFKKGTSRRGEGESLKRLEAREGARVCNRVFVHEFDVEKTPTRLLEALVSLRFTDVKVNNTDVHNWLRSEK